MPYPVPSTILARHQPERPDSPRRGSTAIGTRHAPVLVLRPDRTDIVQAGPSRAPQSLNVVDLTESDDEVFIDALESAEANTDEEDHPQWSDCPDADAGVIDEKGDLISDEGIDDSYWESMQDDDKKSFISRLELAEIYLGYRANIPRPKTADAATREIDLIALGFTNQVVDSDDWVTKKNALCAILHLVMAALFSPLGEGTVAHLPVFLNTALISLSAKDRARLYTDYKWTRLMWDVRVEANARAHVNIFRLPDPVLLDAVCPMPSHTIDDDAHVYWDWLLSDDLIVAKVRTIPALLDPKEPVRDFRFYILHLENDLGLTKDGYLKYKDITDEAELDARSYQIAMELMMLCIEILDAATRPHAHWRTVASAACTFAGFCDKLAVERELWEKRHRMWSKVRQQTRNIPVRVDQYLRRLVEALLPWQRRDLAMFDKGNSTILEGLEDLLPRTRRLRTMRELETVRKMLVEALKEQDVQGKGKGRMFEIQGGPL